MSRATVMPPLLSSALGCATSLSRANALLPVVFRNCKSVPSDGARADRVSRNPLRAKPTACTDARRLHLRSAVCVQAKSIDL